MRNLSLKDNIKDQTKINNKDLNSFRDKNSKKPNLNKQKEEIEDPNFLTKGFNLRY